MSEHILQSLMQLFGIISRINGKNNDERAIVEQFLSNRLNLEETDNYLKLFQEHASGEKKNRISVADSSKMLIICTSINEELTQRQKYSILMLLFVLVNADEDIDKQEREFLQSVADVFNISYELYPTIEKFCTAHDVMDLDDETFIIMDSKKKGRFKKSKHIHANNMNGFMAFMKVPDQNLFLTKYIGEDFNMLNGQTMEQARPYTFLIGSIIRGEHLAPIYYADLSSKFMLDEKTAQISFEADEISFKLRDGRTLMHPISVSESNQSLVAIMGPSGAGKSTLMELLNGIKKPSTGHVRINQYDLHKDKDKVEGMIGYVPQDDLLIEELTVFENLYYAAKLCYGSYNDEQLEKVVHKTLDDLGLSEIKDFQVGSPMQKVISGGERKRVNIGLELLRQPPVMFVDEPTSGLSSNDSLNIIGILKELALMGKIIFTVIHQPSSDIFKLFDKLVILDTGGYPVYYGHPLESLNYFRSSLNQINKEKAVCSECGNVNNEQIFDIIEAKTVNEQGYFTKIRRVQPKQWSEMFHRHKEKIKFSAKQGELKSEQNIAKRFKQFVVFTTRDLKSKLSNQQYMAINLLQAPFLAFILGMLNRYSPGDSYYFGGNENIPVFFFISVITALFMGLVVSAEEIFKDRKILKREQFLNLSRSSYLSSKLFILFGFSAVQTLSFVAIGSLILGIEAMFWQYWLILFSVSCFANLLGLNISATFNSAVTIYILIPILIIPQLVLGGVVIDYDKLNENFKFTDRATPLVGDVMVCRWAYESLMVSQFMTNPFQQVFYPYEQQLAVNNYKKLHKLPNMQNLHSFFENDADTADAATLRDNFLLFKNSLDQECRWAKIENPMEGAVVGPLDSLMLRKLNLTLHSLGKVYNNNISKYENIKVLANQKLLDRLGSVEAYQQLEQNVHNKQIENIVLNRESENRILVYEHHYLPKIYPIYMSPTPQYALDYRAPMFMPIKHFAGKYFTTLGFNVGVIWMMTIFLFIFLYFNGLSGLVGLVKKIRTKV